MNALFNMQQEWLPALRSYLITGHGFSRVVSVELYDEVRRREDWLNQILCRGAAVTA